jgi:hypothetical protein
MEALSHLRQLGECLRLQQSSTSRNNHGDYGSMYSVGSRVTMSGNKIEPYASNQLAARILPHAVAAQRYLGFTAFPSVLRNAQDTERDLGAVAIPLMEQKNPRLRVEELHANGKARISLTMDASCNLSNSSHFDIHDAGPGFAVWTETVPGAAKIGTLFSQICMELTLAMAFAVVSLLEWQ